MIALKKFLMLVVVAVAFDCVLAGNSRLSAQGQQPQILVEMPFQTNNDSYYERQGVDFGFFLRGGQGPGSRVVGLSPVGQLLPNVVFSQNSVGSAVPPFGGFDPNTQATLGFGVLGDDGGFTVGLFAGKGNQRTSVTQSPMVVVPNGGVGSVFSGQLRPFVTGVTPVLGNGFGGNGFGPMLMNPPQPDGQAFRSDRITEQRSKSGPSSFSDPNSTAMRGDLSVEAIERQRQAALAQQSQEFLADIKKLVKDADKMVEREKYGAARAKYARAIRKLAKFPQFSELRESISKKLSEIQSRR